MDFNADLNKVLKYGTEEERQAFEKNIDDNPLESTNHTVYADWLEDQGDHEEAAFRRSMGEWIGSHKLKADSKRRTVDGHLPMKNAPEGLAPIRNFRFSPLGVEVHRHQTLPTGVDQTLFPKTWVTNTGDDSGYSSTFPHGGELTPEFSSSLFWRWPSYRRMESAFRKAFKSKHSG